jgi:chemotaxis protein methyltransferase CheR
MDAIALSDREFRQFQTMIHNVAGIHMSDVKKALVGGRLSKRLKEHGLNSYGDYFKFLSQEKDEFQVAVDLLTTNETYFFREPKHFDLLRNRIIPELQGPREFKVWSGASSSGEEPYSIAMTLAEVLGDKPWSVLGSDISTKVLKQAASGHYSMQEVEDIPRSLLTKYCLKGIGSQQGTVLMSQQLRDRVHFKQINLNSELPRLGEFDVIFLRNVMIYFNAETKRKVVQRMLPMLRPGGFFLVSHSESLNGVTDALQMVSPSVYRKP